MSLIHQLSLALVFSVSAAVFALCKISAKYGVSSIVRFTLVQLQMYSVLQTLALPACATKLMEPATKLRVSALNR